MAHWYRMLWVMCLSKKMFRLTELVLRWIVCLGAGALKWVPNRATNKVRNRVHLIVFYIVLYKLSTLNDVVLVGSTGVLFAALLLKQPVGLLPVLIVINICEIAFHKSIELGFSFVFRLFVLVLFHLILYKWKYMLELKAN